MDAQTRAAGIPIPDTLNGRDFVAASIVDDGAEFLLVLGSSIRIHFKADEDFMEATAGCNAIGGPYQLSSDWTLEFTGDVLTKMWCGPALGKQEEWFVRFLKSQPKVTVHGDTLELIAGTSWMTLLEPEGLNSEYPLIGPHWSLSSIQNGDELMNVPSDVAASVAFGADGKVQVHTGCNYGFGMFQISKDNKVWISHLALTRRACRGAEEEVQREMLAFLSGSPLRANVQDSSLTLTSDQGALHFIPGDEEVSD